MALRGRGILAGLIVLVSASLLSPPNAHATSYAIGDTGPGGGVVFITPTTTGNSTGLYFEARLSGVNRAACLYRADFQNNVTDTAIGAGAANTTAIRDECTVIDARNDATNSAFAWVTTQTINGYSDWFIPSTGEGERIWVERTTASVGALITSLNGSWAWMSRVQNDGLNPNNPEINVLLKNIGPTPPTTTSLNAANVNFLIARSFAVNAGDSSPGIPSFVDFRYYLPDGRECTSISPQRVQVGTFVTLPGEDALCRTSEGSLVAGWTIPVPAGFTGAGSSSLPLSPGHRVRVIESQRFTVVPFEPMITVEYDANIAADDACTPANMAFASEDGRMGYSWVPRMDFSLARTWAQAPCVPDGYELSGWNTAGDGSGESLRLDEPLPESWGSSMVNERRLFAVWRAA